MSYTIRIVLMSAPGTRFSSLRLCCITFQAHQSFNCWSRAAHIVYSLRALCPELHHNLPCNEIDNVKPNRKMAPSRVLHGRTMETEGSSSLSSADSSPDISLVTKTTGFRQR